MTTKDDRILPLTRMVAGFIIIILLLAFILLHIFPHKTDVWFAWTIQPSLMAMLMGAGYLGGSFFFWRVFTTNAWHRVGLAYLPVALFTVMMLFATLLHWDRFHHGTWQFYLWTAVYIATPVLVPFLWWQNKKTESSIPETEDVLIPSNIRWALGSISSIVLVLSLILFLTPAWYIDISPWELTALNARVFASFLALVTSAGLSAAFDPRWSSTKYMVQAVMVGLLFMTLAFVRAWGDLNPANLLTWVYLAAFILGLIGLGMVHWQLDLRSRQKPG